MEVIRRVKNTDIFQIILPKTPVPHLRRLCRISLLNT